jgi:hypothetical protein
MQLATEMKFFSHANCSLLENLSPDIDSRQLAWLKNFISVASCIQNTLNWH